MPRILSNNWAVKLASLALAIALWFFIVGVPELVTVEAVPLVYGGLPPGLVLLSNPPDSVRLELRGPSREIARGNLVGLKVLMDFSAIEKPGEHTFTISEMQLNLPPGVTFLRAIPPQLALSFDQVDSREVPVEVRTKGTPAAGHHISRNEATPERVKITGPASRLSTVNVVATEPVDVADRTQSFETKVPTSLAEPGVKVDSPAPVTVKISIEKGTRLPE